MTQDLHQLGVAELAAALAARQVSAVETAQHFLGRIGQHSALGAFVALDPRDGSIKALVGGFDFEKNKFNHVSQAWRQPGSSFKPFIYSAALEKGFTPATIVNDAPLFFDAGVTGTFFFS